MSTTSNQTPVAVIAHSFETLGNKKTNSPGLHPVSLAEGYLNIQRYRLSFILYKSVVTLPNAMRSKGLVPPENIQPGVKKRFSTNGKSTDKAGWVYLYPGNQLAQLATYGDDRTQKNYFWHVSKSMALLKYSVIYLNKTASGSSNAKQAQFNQILSISITFFK